MCIFRNEIWNSRATAACKCGDGRDRVSLKYTIKTPNTHIRFIGMHNNMCAGIGRLCIWPITVLGCCTIYVYRLYIIWWRPTTARRRQNIAFSNGRNIAGRVHDLIAVYPKVRFNIGRDVCLLTLYMYIYIMHILL